jgi:hypothetical protein
MRGTPVGSDPRRKCSWYVCGNTARGFTPKTMATADDQFVLELRQRICPSTVGKICWLFIVSVYPPGKFKAPVSWEDGYALIR